MTSDVGVKGKVQIFTKDGKKIWENSNMVTNVGKQLFCQIISADLASDTGIAFARASTPAFLLMGSGSYESGKLDANVSGLANPVDTFLPYESKITGVSDDIMGDYVNVGGNSVTYQFQYSNQSEEAYNITELGLYSQGRTLLCYEPIGGATISAEAEMTLIVKWTITFI